MKIKVIAAVLALAFMQIPAETASGVSCDFDLGSSLLETLENTFNEQSHAIVEGAAIASASYFFEGNTEFDIHQRELKKLGSFLALNGTPVISTRSSFTLRTVSSTEEVRTSTFDKTLVITVGDLADKWTTDWEYRSIVDIRQECLSGGLLGTVQIRPLADSGLHPVDDFAYVHNEPPSRLSRMLPGDSGYNRLTIEQKMLVAAYALKYALDSNAAYPVEAGTDCTNFASQALKAGGWKTIGNGSYSQISDYRYWGFWGSGYQDLTWTSASWYRAQGLFSHSTEKTAKGWLRGVYSSNNVVYNAKQMLMPGDLIFVNWEGNTGGDIDHVMVVTSNANNQILISQHSTGRRNFKLADSVSNAAITTDWFLVTT